MMDDLPEKIREELHDVLYYLVESEAKSHYRRMDEDGHGYDTYEKVRDLIQHFELEELAELDLHYHDLVFHIDDEWYP